MNGLGSDGIDSDDVFQVSVRPNRSGDHPMARDSLVVWRRKLAESHASWTCTWQGGHSTEPWDLKWGELENCSENMIDHDWLSQLSRASFHFV